MTTPYELNYTQVKLVYQVKIVKCYIYCINTSFTIKYYYQEVIKMSDSEKTKKIFAKNLLKYMERHNLNQTDISEINRCFTTISI